MEDPQKVKKVKDQLNHQAGSEVWDDVVGFHQLSVVDIEHKTVDPSSGITVKLFVNLETWEIKTYFFKRFLKDE